MFRLLDNIFIIAKTELLQNQKKSYYSNVKIVLPWSP